MYKLQFTVPDVRLPSLIVQLLYIFIECTFCLLQHPVSLFLYFVPTSSYFRFHFLFLHLSL
jgi:hypothetical protein